MAPRPLRAWRWWRALAVFLGFFRSVDVTAPALVLGGYLTAGAGEAATQSRDAALGAPYGVGWALLLTQVDLFTGYWRPDDEPNKEDDNGNRISSGFPSNSAGTRGAVRGDGRLRRGRATDSTVADHSVRGVGGCGTPATAITPSLPTRSPRHRSRRGGNGYYVQQPVPLAALYPWVLQLLRIVHNRRTQPTLHHHPSHLIPYLTKLNIRRRLPCRLIVNELTSSCWSGKFLFPLQGARFFRS